jgi:hypothetical protein
MLVKHRSEQGSDSTMLTLSALVSDQDTRTIHHCAFRYPNKQQESEYASPYPALLSIPEIRAGVKIGSDSQGN